MNRYVKYAGDAFFKLIHSRNLIYNTCWEDPRIDRSALEIAPTDEVLVITSAGCNALDYALAGAKHVHAVDVNARQNALLELKLAAVKGLRYPTFFKMFGKGYLPHIALNYPYKLRPHLSVAARRIWDRHIWMFSGEGWRSSFYFRGSSGFVARVLNLYIDRGARIRAPLRQLIESDSIEMQREIFNEIFPKLWKAPIRWAMDRDVCLTLLGVPTAQRQHVEKFASGSISAFVERCLHNVFTSLPIADNYFWRVYITGEYTERCCPEYLKYENYLRLRDGLSERISVHTASVTDFLRGKREPINKFVLLDHMDWLATQDQALAEELQQIVRRAAPGARLIWRSGGTRTDFVDQAEVRVRNYAIQMGELLKYDHQRARDLHSRDRVQTYGSFHIADLLAA